VRKIRVKSEQWNCRLLDLNGVGRKRRPITTSWWIKCRQEENGRDKRQWVVLRAVSDAVMIATSLFGNFRYGIILRVTSFVKHKYDREAELNSTRRELRFICKEQGSYHIARAWFMRGFSGATDWCAGPRCVCIRNTAQSKSRPDGDRKRFPGVEKQQAVSGNSWARLGIVGNAIATIDMLG